MSCDFSGFHGGVNGCAHAEGTGGGLRLGCTRRAGVAGSVSRWVLALTPKCAGVLEARFGQLAPLADGSDVGAAVGASSRASAVKQGRGAERVARCCHSTLSDLHPVCCAYGRAKP